MTTQNYHPIYYMQLPNICHCHERTSYSIIIFVRETSRKGAGNMTITDILEKEYDAYEQEYLVRLYSTFQEGIEEINRVEKKFKRKKYVLSDEDKKMFEICRNHIEKREKQFYPYLLNLIKSEDEEEKLWIREELTFFVQNKWGVMNTFLEWELDIKEREEK